jgi:hypothetical protein
MRKPRLWRYLNLLLLSVVIISIGLSGTAFATTSSSTHYSVDQTQFGSGSNSQSCSTQYCASVSIGDAAAGSSVSASKAVNFGSITNSQPELEMIVTPGASNLGVLSTDSTSYSTTNVQVLNYLSSGYVLQILGTPPKYGTHTLATNSSPTAATPGIEQFGINAVANTFPTVGADPVQTPSSATSFGVVNTNYDIPNLFMYSSGDNVAHSSTSSGITSYTISMIVDISDATPAGHYSGDFSVVAIPVF